jgi:hypothetical protein
MMNRQQSSVGATVLALCFVAATAGASVPPPAPDAPRSFVPSAGAGEQRLSDDEALEHLKTLQADTRRPFTEAAERLRAKGYTPTRTVHVLRSEDPNRQPIRPAEERFVSYEGELVFWTWSDGHDGTWEGVVYYEDYASGQFATWTAQVDVSTTEFDALWAEKTAGGTSYRDGERMTALPAPSDATATRVASVLPMAAPPGAASPDIALVQFNYPGFKQFVRCLVANGCTPFCVLMGPSCAAAYCPISSIRCGGNLLW